MEVLKQVENLVATKIEMVKTIFSMVKMEARLAGLSIFPLLINVCLLLVIFMTLWLLSSLLIGYGILFWTQSIFLSLCSVFVINLGLFAGLVKYLSFNVKNMSFKQTRAYLQAKQGDA